MSFKTGLEDNLEAEEKRTVSDSFGGPALDGRAPNYVVNSISDYILQNLNGESCDNERLVENFNVLKGKFNEREFKYFMQCAVRHSFLIELTNLSITSTKMKTRWLPGRIVKTQPSSFQNYEGEFSPGNDPRSNTYDECFEVFTTILELLHENQECIDIIKKLSISGNRGVAYEFVTTYANIEKNPIHSADNIQIANTEDLLWLVESRSIIREVLTSKNKDKIATKTYKTDRSQTGEVQTNRAKRWECLTYDFQFATLEQCWSVERVLLSSLVDFEGFPSDVRDKFREKDLMEEFITARCPITFFPLKFQEFINSSVHGESKFQIGHLTPLKADGNHTGANIAWISDDGNRIQGSLTVEQTINMIKKIYENYVEFEV